MSILAFLVSSSGKTVFPALLNKQELGRGGEKQTVHHSSLVLAQLQRHRSRANNMRDIPGSEVEAEV